MDFASGSITYDNYRPEATTFSTRYSPHFGKFKYLPDEEHINLLKYNCDWILVNVCVFKIALNLGINLEAVQAYRRIHFNLINALIIRHKSLDNSWGAYAKSYVLTRGQAPRGRTWDWGKIVEDAKNLEQQWEDGGITPPQIQPARIKKLAHDRRREFETTVTDRDRYNPFYDRNKPWH